MQKGREGANFAHRVRRARGRKGRGEGEGGREQGKALSLLPLREATPEHIHSESRCLFARQPVYIAVKVACPVCPLVGRDHHT